MNEVFGIPAEGLATAVAAILAVGLGTVAVLAARNPVLAKLGLRNVPRRRGRTALIVVGLMLATTIIGAALATGDTMSRTVRAYVVDSLGQTDEVVSVNGTDVNAVAIGDSSQVAYFPEIAYEAVRTRALQLPEVDGVAPAIVEVVAVQAPRSRQSEPRVTLFGSDPAALADFAPIRAGGREVALDDLAPGEAYLTTDAADELGTRAGDRVLVLARGRPTPFRVRDVVTFKGAGTADAAVLVDLRTAQELLGAGPQIEHILISNRGDEVSGAALSDTVVRKLSPMLGYLGLDVDAEKQDGLEAADAEGAAMMSLFTTFGSFSIAAGILLIFLIFVMLAAERRGELGIARAIGTRRSHLVQMYVFEGVAYDLAAAVVGTALGVAVAFSMVYAISGSLSAFDVEIGFGVSGRSLLLAYTLGVLLTLVVVAVSAWRVSRVNITAAVRNLPDPGPKRRGRRRFVLAPLAALFGVLMVVAGIASADAVPFMVGVSIVVIAGARIARTLGVADRVAYTTAGVATVVFWLLPTDTFAFITDFKMGYGVFLTGGLMIVVGATWVIMYNAPVLLRGLTWAFGRFGSLAAVLRLAVAYPLRSLFRTGVTLAMFTLVVFTLVAGVTISGSFNNAWNDLELFGGGFDVRAVAAPASPVRDIDAAVRKAPGIDARDVRVAASQSIVPLEAKQAGTTRKFATYVVTGLDDAFLRRTTYGFAALADGYGSAREVWNAVRTRPGLAVVDPDVVPRRDNYEIGVKPDFALSGFYLEDGHFRPIPVTVRDRQTNQEQRLTVIGVLPDTAPIELAGISTSQTTLAGALGARAAPTVYWLDLAPGVDARATARRVESALLGNGVEAEALDETLENYVAYSQTFNYLIEGFMGLGLVVGVAALGVISARAVVERRQQIGVLRSIGFRRNLIQAAFLIESSFVSLTAIVVGTLLGLAISWNIVADSAEQASWGHLTLDVPWLALGVIFVVVYAVALLTTLAPAVRASRVVPAEALRYQ